MRYLWMLWETCGVKREPDRQEGQGLIEYALIIALVAILLVSALFLLGGQLVTSYTSIRDSLIAPS